MFGGAYYIWIMAAFFLMAVVVVGGLMLVLWIGHQIEKKETGARHGFLELPEELRGGDDVQHEGTKSTKDHEGGDGGEGEGAADGRG